MSVSSRHWRFYHTRHVIPARCGCKVQLSWRSSTAACHKKGGDWLLLWELPATQCQICNVAPCHNGAKLWYQWYQFILFSAEETGLVPVRILNTSDKMQTTDTQTVVAVVLQSWSLLKWTCSALTIRSKPKTILESCYLIHSKNCWSEAQSSWLKWKAW